MNTAETLTLIKESFETWYNKNIAKDFPVSIVINYSDVQTLLIKAYHTIKMEVKVLSIKSGSSNATPLLMLQENYNHGITTEEEAKEEMVKKLLMQLYSYK